MSKSTTERQPRRKVTSAGTPEGIVFSKDFPKRVEEVHYMKSELDFRAEKQPRDYAIALCKIWISRGRRKKNSSPPVAIAL